MRTKLAGRTIVKMRLTTKLPNMQTGNRITKTTVLTVIALATLLYTGACKRNNDTDDSARNSIDHLRALPYAGTAVDVEPEKLGVSTFDESRSQPGYNLITLYEMSQAVLFDAQGTTLQTWSIEDGRCWFNCKLLPNGDLIALGADDAIPRQEHVPANVRYMARFNWKGQLLSKHYVPVHLDFELLENGNILTLTFESRIIPQIDRIVATRDDAITELTPSGRIATKLSLYDALTQSHDGFKLQNVAPNDWGYSRIIDLFHANSIETMRRETLADKHPIYDLDNVLVCFRHQDAIAIVSRSTGRALWTWGQGEVLGPHDATVLDNGNILLFDNGLGRKWSRIIELDPLKKKIVWEYTAPTKTDFYTMSRGSNQRLENGNTLIAESDAGRAFEITPTGDIVWDYYSPPSEATGKRSTIVRIRRYPAEYIKTIHDATQKGK